MKKLLLTLSTIALTTAPLVTVVACSATKGESPIIPDWGTEENNWEVVTDKSTLEELNFTNNIDSFIEDAIKDIVIWHAHIELYRPTVGQTTIWRPGIYYNTEESFESYATTRESDFSAIDSEWVTDGIEYYYSFHITDPSEFISANGEDYYSVIPPLGPINNMYNYDDFRREGLTIDNFPQYTWYNKSTKIHFEEEYNPAFLLSEHIYEDGKFRIPSVITP